MGAMKQPVEDNPYYGEFNPFWERLAAAVAEIGDDPLTFKLLGDAYQPFDADERTTICLSARSYRMPPRCLRTLPRACPERSLPLEGYVINRKTMVNPSYVTMVAGVLKMDHQGYYTPKLQSTVGGNT
jgi:hypothetical protein